MCAANETLDCHLE